MMIKKNRTSKIEIVMLALAMVLILYLMSTVVVLKEEPYQIIHNVVFKELPDDKILVYVTNPDTNVVSTMVIDEYEKVEYIKRMQDDFRNKSR